MYVLYIATVLLYQFQAFGLGIAWLSFWPGPEHAGVMQAVTLAILVLGTGMMFLAFLRPVRLTRGVFHAGIILAALAFLSSAWDFTAYRIGSVILLGLTVSAMVASIRQLRRHDVSTRWFAAGVTALMIGGATQSLAMFAPGTGTTGLAGVVFPIGILVQAACWLIALISRFAAHRKALMERLRRRASQDRLTGAYDRAYLCCRIQSSLKTTGDRERVPAMVLLLDLDHFKRVNERHGHTIGDAVLRQATALMRKKLPEGAVVGRFGGDQLLGLVFHAQARPMAIGAATTLVNCFRQPMLVLGQRVDVRASIGLVSLDAGQQRVDEVIRQADIALDEAKAAGGDQYVELRPDMAMQARERGQLRAGLADALAGEGISVVYQPVVDRYEMRIIGFEALTRWQPEGGKLFEHEQIRRLAAEAGLAPALGGHLLATACADLRRWQQDRRWPEGAFISLDLSAEQLLGRRIVDQIRDCLAASPVDPETLRVEIAEPTLGKCWETARPVLAELAGRGVSCIVDAFGTGQAGLPMLAELKPDQLKLDPTLIDALPRRGREQDLARAAAAVAAELNATIAAAGVETDQQLELVMGLGIDVVQGRASADPISGDELMDWVCRWCPGTPLFMPMSASEQVH
jgi:diguanylate cyclase (GGDEF)-like protein